MYPLLGALGISSSVAKGCLPPCLSVNLSGFDSIFCPSVHVPPLTWHLCEQFTNYPGRSSPKTRSPPKKKLGKVGPHRTCPLTTILGLPKRLFILLPTLLGSTPSLLACISGIYLFFSPPKKFLPMLALLPCYLLPPLSWGEKNHIESATDYHSESFRKVNPAPGR